MKKLLISAAVAMSLTAQAEEKQDICGMVNELAGSIMSARQRGVDMAQAMKLAGENAEADFIRQIIIAAYEKPRYSVAENQQAAVTDFKNSVYLICVKSQ